MPKCKRLTLPGYPKDFVFETRADLDKYLSGDRVGAASCVGLRLVILEVATRGDHAGPTIGRHDEGRPSASVGVGIHRNDVARAVQSLDRQAFAILLVKEGHGIGISAALHLGDCRGTDKQGNKGQL